MSISVNLGVCEVTGSFVDADANREWTVTQLGGGIWVGRGGVGERM